MRQQIHLVNANIQLFIVLYKVGLLLCAGLHLLCSCFKVILCAALYLGLLVFYLNKYYMSLFGMFSCLRTRIALFG